MYLSTSSDVLLPVAKREERPAGLFLRLALAWLLILSGLAGLAMGLGCGSAMQVKGEVSLRQGARWVLLPFADYSESPQSAERAEDLASSLVRVRWNIDLERYPEFKEAPNLSSLDERQRYDQALKWARGAGFTYGLTGSVQEWRNLRGDGEAAVGISLRVINIESGRPAWVATGSRSGFGAQPASGVASRLLSEMLAKLPLR